MSPRTARRYRRLLPTPSPADQTRPPTTPCAAPPRLIETVSTCAVLLVGDAGRRHSAGAMGHGLAGRFAAVTGMVDVMLVLLVSGLAWAAASAVAHLRDRAALRFQPHHARLFVVDLSRRWSWRPSLAARWSRSALDDGRSRRTLVAGGWAVWMSFSLCCVGLATLHRPLFNKFTPLEDGRWRAHRGPADPLRLSGAAASSSWTARGVPRTATPISPAWAQQAHRLLRHAAAVSSKPEQIEAVLAHELATSSCRHIRKRMRGERTEPRSRDSPCWAG